MSHSRVFEERIREELNAAVDVDKLKRDVERMRKAVANNEAARKMLARQMDRLDASDANYERKYEEMQARLDALYEESAAIEAEFDEAQLKLDSAEESRVTTERVYVMMDEFEEKFDSQTDAKKKEMIQSIVETVQISPDADPKKGETIVKNIRFKCPVSFHSTLQESMFDLLGIKEFNRLETCEY